MSRKAEDRRARMEAAIRDLVSRLAQVLDRFAGEDQPVGQRLKDGMGCLKGLALSELPEPMQERIDGALGTVNDILATYRIETWEDYQRISQADFIRIHRLFIDLAFNL